MWSFLHECFNEIKNIDEKLQIWKPKAGEYSSVCRDALTLKKKAAAPSKLKKKSTTDCEDAITEPLLRREDEKKDFIETRRYGMSSSSSSSNVEEKEKGAIRVKIMMTKQEAARLLSKCKDGGHLEFMDVARALQQIPMSRVSLVDFSRTSPDNRCALDAIPEEL